MEARLLLAQQGLPRRKKYAEKESILFFCGVWVRLIACQRRQDLLAGIGMMGLVWSGSMRYPSAVKEMTADG
jgi:hypothetical protein